jgi:hypothetical protein
VHATEELERKINAIKLRNKMEYGRIVGYFITRKELKSINIKERHEELVNYYSSNSNLELEELLIVEIKNDYNRELEMYNRCYERLKELHFPKHYKIFNNFDKNKIFECNDLS